MCLGAGRACASLARSMGLPFPMRLSRARVAVAVAVVLGQLAGSACASNDTTPSTSARAAARATSGATSATRRRPSVPPGFFGVAATGPVLDGTVSLGHELRRMRANGVQQITVAFDWVAAQPYARMADVPARRRASFVGERGVPTAWKATDRIVGAAAAVGFRVLPVVVQAPIWDRLHPTRPFAPPTRPGPFGAFVGAAARRYGSRGSFWRAHPRLRRVPIRDWQIWNEPAGGLTPTDPSVFWQDAAPWQHRYVGMLRAAHAALRSSDPRARTVVAGLVGKSWLTLQTLYRAGARPYFDAVALHPYTGEANRVDDVVLYCRRVLRAHGDRRRRFILTEVSWPSLNNGSYKATGARSTANSQAVWARKALRELTSERKQLGIDSLFWYTWASSDRSGFDAFDYAGLTRLTAAGRLVAKPVLGVYSKLALRSEGRR